MPFQVYRNDLKTMTADPHDPHDLHDLHDLHDPHDPLDPNPTKPLIDAIWDDHTRHAYESREHHTIEYRINECVGESYVSLDLSHMRANCFDQLDASGFASAHANKIQYLFASNSQLHTVPRIDQFTCLRVLDVSESMLCTLPRLPCTLEELVCRKNKLTSIPDGLDWLKRLDCSDNQIHTIQSMGRVESMHLQSNPLESIGSTYPMVRYLDISGTRVQSLPVLDRLDWLVGNDSYLEDLSQLVRAKNIEIVGSRVSQIHWIDGLEKLIYHRDDRIVISKNYQIDRMKMNRNNTIEVAFVMGSVDKGSSEHA
jgi:Leucine-rich repeat (LRR) protein